MIFPFLALFLILALPAWAEEARPGPADGQGELSLPWNVFEKLMRLDQDNVLLTWDEFQRLLKQTGVRETPPYQMQNGQVSLGRDEFKKLLDRMKPPSGEGAKHYLTKAVYTGRVDRKGTKITARLRVQVVADGAFSPLRISLFPGQMAFEDILLDGRPALVESDGGGTFITIPRPGDQEITAVFSLPATLDKEPYRLNFNVPETPITQIDLLLAAANLDARVDGASQVQTTPAEGGTRLRASLPQTGAVSLTWNAVEPEQARGPAKVYAVVHNLFSIQDDAVSATARVELDVLQNTINNLSIQLPEGYTLLDVTGEAVGEWKMRGEGGRTLFIPFDYSRKGKFNVTVRVERPFKEKGGVVPFDGFTVLGAVRESGDLLIESSTNGEVKVVDTTGLIRLDAREVPAPLKSLSNQTFLDAFKYIRPPIRLGLDIQRHEEIAVVSSVVDAANAVTLLLKDGKCVAQVTYSLKNTAKQFMELRLPAGAEVWSVFVEGRPVKPSKNEAGTTLIPLNRSRIEGQNLIPFDVEVLYFRNLGRHALGGVDLLEVPQADLKVSQLIWSVYLPTERDYLYFGGTVDKEKEAEGWKPLISSAKGKRRILSRLAETAANEAVQMRGKENLWSRSDARKRQAKQSVQYLMKSEFDESQGVNDDAFTQQVERELSFFGNMNRPEVAGATVGGEPGALPIRIKVPNSGQIYRFSKILVQENEPATLRTVSIVHGLMVALKGLGFLFVLFLLYQARLIFLKGLKAAKAFVDRHPNEMGWIKTPPGMTAAWFVLGILLSFVWGFLGLVSFLACFFSLGWWVWSAYLKRKGAQ